MEQTLLVIAGIVSMIFLPVLISLVDFIPAFRAEGAKAITPADDLAHAPTYDDFAVLVPIYGNIRYLENVEFLSQYGDRVVLATTDHESEEFNADLAELTARYGFQVARESLEGGGADSGKRSTTSPIRDVIIRAAVREVTREYVVCLDADSFPEIGFEYLVGAMRAAGLDVASIRLEPSNEERLLGKIQVIEYFLAMNLRRIIPWLVSGGCHAATTEAYRQVMEKHSMFFQGNDVEVGLLAERMGYRVGHVQFRVGTEVPDRVKPWYRQRYAWSGGEWRLGIANIRLAPSHPLFFFYVTVIMIGMFPIRWYAVITAPWVLLIVAAIYLVGISILRRKEWTWTCMVYPLYSFFNSLIMTPLGGISYLNMSIRHRNWGIIDTDRTRRPLSQPEPPAN